MRIWIVHQHAVPPLKMGPTRHFELARELIRKGHEVFIFAGNYCHNNFHTIAEPYSVKGQITYYEGVPFIFFGVPNYKNNSLKRLWNMVVFGYKLLHTRRIKDLPKPDLIIGSSPSPFAAYSAEKLAARFGIPFIYEIRDLWPETLVRIGKFSRYHPLVIILQKIENKLLQRSKKIISVLPGVKDYLKAKKIKDKNFVWIPNFADISGTSYEPMSHADHITVVYTGSFNVANDVETLLAAAKILNEREPGKFCIKIFGDGPYKDKFLETIADNNLTNVFLQPAVEKNKIPKILAHADILVAMVKKSELYRFGTSLNKISDYLAAARPIVFALDSPYSPINDANSGITVAPEDPMALAEAISKLATLKPHERERLGFNGRRYAEETLNLQILASQLVSELHVVINA